MPNYLNDPPKMVHRSTHSKYKIIDQDGDIYTVVPRNTIKE